MIRIFKFGLIGLILTFGGMTLAPRDAVAMNRVQLSVFMVNIKVLGINKTGQMPLTVYLDLLDQEEAEYVCGIAPIVRDAILRNLSKKTFLLDKSNKIDVKNLRLELWPIAYKAIA